MLHIFPKWAVCWMEWSEGKFMLEYCGSQWDWCCPLRDIWKFEGRQCFWSVTVTGCLLALSGPLSRAALTMKSVCLPHDSICPTGQLCRWKTCYQSYELRSITQCFRVFKFCLLFRVQLISKECSHCVNQGMTVLCFVRNFIKGLLCHWQWFCLSFWGHPCKVHSIYIGSWCVHGNFSWVQASDHSFMISSVVVCMLRYVSLYCMLPFLYIIYIYHLLFWIWGMLVKFYTSGLIFQPQRCSWSNTSSCSSSTNNFPECIDTTTGQSIDLFEIIYAYMFYNLWISLQEGIKAWNSLFKRGHCVWWARDASPAPHSRRRCVHSKPTNAQCAREWAGTTPVPVTAQLNHHVARNDQVAAVLRKQLREIRVAEGTLFSELLASTLALIYKS